MAVQILYWAGLDVVFQLFSLDNLYCMLWHLQRVVLAEQRVLYELYELSDHFKLTFQYTESYIMYSPQREHCCHD
jgi:hypothetical protein